MPTLNFTSKAAKSFAKKYEEKFPDGCKLDNKGRVILD